VQAERIAPPLIAKVSLAILPFENFASPQRARLIFLRNRHLSRCSLRSIYDKTMLAVTSEVSKGNMASLFNFYNVRQKVLRFVCPKFLILPQIMIEKWKEKSKWRKRRNKLLDTVQLPERGRVLDLSCGDGQFLELVHLSRPILGLVGVDISEEKIKDAQKEYGWGSFAVKNAGSLSFPNKSFDTIFCNMSLHHYDEPIKMLSEAGRVLKENGNMYIMDLFPKNKISQAVYNLRGCNDDCHFEKYYTLQEFKKTISVANLKMNKAVLLSLLPRLMLLELKLNLAS